MILAALLFCHGIYGEDFVSSADSEGFTGEAGVTLPRGVEEAWEEELPWGDFAQSWEDTGFGGEALVSSGEEFSPGDDGFSSEAPAVWGNGDAQVLSEDFSSQAVPVMAEPAPGYVVVVTVVSRPAEPSEPGANLGPALLGLSGTPVQLSVESLPEAQIKEEKAEKIPFFSKRQEVVSYLREQMVKRSPEAAFSLRVKGKPEEMEKVLSFGQDVLKEAMEHTGEGREGDYLLWNYKESSWVAKAQYDGKITTYTVSYTLEYFTTEEEEKRVDELLAKVYAELDLSGLSDYEKVKAIYDYVLDHTQYDEANLHREDYTKKFTAYAALVDHQAVCQGYGSLLYRMLLDNGIDCRCIPGTGKTPEGMDGHLWNILRLGEEYYCVDVTWDDQPVRIYRYFLKEEDFFEEEHFPDGAYLTKTFLKEYPLAQSSYDAGEEPVREESGEVFTARE